jgi:hypothetical protein
MTRQKLAFGRAADFSNLGANKGAAPIDFPHVF